MIIRESQLLIVGQAPSGEDGDKRRAILACPVQPRFQAGIRLENPLE